MKIITKQHEGGGMIDLSLGKAIIAVETESENPCSECCFELFAMGDSCVFDCSSNKRRDGKDVVYKTVDYKAEVFDKTKK
jgi:hypothetical protein